MAAGDRDKNGRATDVVYHFVPSIIPVAYPFCGQKKFWASTTVWENVTCKKCLKIKASMERVSNTIPDGPTLAQAFHPMKIN